MRREVDAFAGPLKYAGRQLEGSLSIVQWRHFMPEYDVWFNGTWAKTWGEKNDVQVTIDHVYNTRLPPLAAAEVKAQQGHDIFGFPAPPAAYEDQVIDHAAIVREIERAVGPYGDIGKRSTYNPKTKKYFGVSDSYVPAPLIWRHDLWNAIGESPASWDHVRLAAPRLKAAGHPIGIGQSNEPESNVALIAFMMCFGSFIQDESNALAIDSKSTVQAVQFMADLYRRGEDTQVFSWTEASNNQFVFSGRGSMILNAISAVRLAENLQLPVANDLWLWPIPEGAIQARAGAIDRRLLDLEVRQEQGDGREVHRRPLHRLPRGDDCLGAVQLPELPRRFSRRGDLQDRGSRYTPTPRQVHDPHHDRVEGHPQHRLPRLFERRRRRDAKQVPDPEDVRRGLAGQDDRRGLGTGDRERDEADLGEVEGRGQALVDDAVHLEHLGERTVHVRAVHPREVADVVRVGVPAVLL